MRHLTQLKPQKRKCNRISIFSDFCIIDKTISFNFMILNIEFKFKNQINIVFATSDVIIYNSEQEKKIFQNPLFTLVVKGFNKFTALKM